MFLFHGCPEYTNEQKNYIRREVKEHTGEDCLFLELFLGRVEHVRTAKEEGGSSEKAPSGNYHM